MTYSHSYQHWKVKHHFFSRNELNFFYELQKHLKKKWVLLFSKVRIADIVTNKIFLKKDNFGEVFNKVSQQHIDYMLTDYKWRIICLVELDGDSHDSNTRTKENDWFKNSFFRVVWIPLLRFKNKWNHKLSRLDDCIEKFSLNIL